ncbi:hypothetical protein M407DRAFT_34062 [Tulasnella calospora MUT 4182]|uniref:Uncharacterized protein n=1 Tax=Tulasnella calospora MUT 4182 TaxID=1051891 RepID=A0A0C3Q190_9AGAM|nr:hypothetical protein M407DRAFT_34062 [Tulasnella calospora MUT 4182]
MSLYLRERHSNAKLGTAMDVSAYLERDVRARRQSHDSSYLGGSTAVARPLRFQMQIMSY